MGLELISRWFKLNKLSSNIKKTHFIIFGNKHSKTNAMPTTTIDGTKCTKEITWEKLEK